MWQPTVPNPQAVPGLGPSTTNRIIVVCISVCVYTGEGPLRTVGLSDKDTFIYGIVESNVVDLAYALSISLCC